MSESLESLLVKIIIGLGTAWATKNGVTVDGDSLQMFAAGAVAMLAGAYGIYRHWGMKKVPVNSVAIATAAPPVPTAIGATTQITGKIVGALALAIGLNLVALGGHAQAQPKTDPNGNAITKVLTVLHDDAVAASADAKANNDTIAQTCYDAIAKIADAKLQAQGTSGGAALLTFQKVRDVTRMNSSPLGTDLIVGCAPLVQDAKINFVQFFANIGGAVLLKGFIVAP